MSLKICSFSSGSSGNCIFIASNTTKILVDVGVPITRVEKSLALLKTNPTDVHLLVTHSHSDHVCSVPSFTQKYGTSAYVHYRTAPSISGKKKPFMPVEFGEEDFFVGDITVSPFAVSHDVPCVGFSFLCDGKKISIATDLGKIDERIMTRIQDSNVVLLECNHDEELLNMNNRYAPWLKKRISGSGGHLSNTECAKAAVRLAQNGVSQLILGHLSLENNYPELAYDTVKRELDSQGIREDVMKIEVAGANRIGKLHEVL